MKITSAASILGSLAPLLTLVNAGEIIELHGSGTTNPSMCFWHIMSLFEARSKNPIRMTYRAVGSSTGQAEFLGVNNTVDAISTDPFQYWPHVDFGAGDIPVSTEAYNLLNKNSGPMVHLPFALSTVSFFVNLDGAAKVDLTGCALAKILNLEITRWDDQELVNLNPDLATAGKGVDINVCHRVNGSSSTASITQYLNKKCPSKWSSDKVGATITWPRDTSSAEGSAGMVACIKGTNGSIGYAESRHGWKEQLTEISVENAEGYYWTAKEAIENGGISDAADEAFTPQSAEDDWGSVNFIDQNGKYTYPIVLMSYVYVRKQIHKYVQGQLERGLLKLFLQSLYMDEYYGRCQQLAFFNVPTKISEVANRGINDIEWEFTTGKNQWAFEIDTMKLVGSNDYIISSKRQSYQGVVLQDVTAEEEEILQDVRQLFETAKSQLGYNQFTDADKQRIDTAIALSAVSFTMIAAVLVGFIVKIFLNQNDVKGYNIPNQNDMKGINTPI